jgi:UDP-N-acetylglucosamine 4,6-dehydratase/5-epimerase
VFIGVGQPCPAKGETMNTNYFTTGGSGTLGKALIKWLQKVDPQCEITVFSRDPMKHKLLPCSINKVIGDVRDYSTLYYAMTGHDVVVHAAAQKHIPEGETNVEETISINVSGSKNVAYAAIEAGIKRVVMISTDKATEPQNVYGATKMLMERMIFDLVPDFEKPQFILCRYGNVLNSTGSVLQIWQRQAAGTGEITITDGEMTRFWMTQEMAVKCVWAAVSLINATGIMIVPKAPAMSVMDMANTLYPDMPKVVIGRRPGEKVHECLITERESAGIIVDHDNYWIISPCVSRTDSVGAYTSDKAPQLSSEVLKEWLA